MKADKVKVWNGLIRSFHWLLVFSFATAYVVEDDYLSLHQYAGYMVLALLGLRIIYGFIGSRYARFSHFIYSPVTAFHYIADVFKFKPKRYVGHNPAGGLMVLLMLISLIATGVSGMFTLAIQDNAGPMVGVVLSLPFWLSGMSEDVHEFFARFSMLLVLVHITGVIVESIVHGENLSQSMIDGRKQTKN